MSSMIKLRLPTHIHTCLHSLTSVCSQNNFFRSLLLYITSVEAGPEATHDTIWMVIRVAQRKWFHDNHLDNRKEMRITFPNGFVDKSMQSYVSLALYGLHFPSATLHPCPSTHISRHIASSTLARRNAWMRLNNQHKHQR